jgi:hypothetical protein
VQARLKELAAPVARKSAVKASELIEDLRADRKRALELGQPAVAIKATMAVAALAGLLIKRTEEGKPGNFEARDRAEVLDAIEAKHGRAVRDLLQEAISK